MVTSRRPAVFQPPEDLLKRRIAELETEVGDLKQRLMDATPVRWTGLRGSNASERVIISFDGLVKTIPLPKAFERDKDWLTSGRCGAVDAAFNPSIFRAADGRVWMLYRIECFPWFRFSRIAVVELNSLFSPISSTNRILDLPTDYDLYNAEDPRIISAEENQISVAYNNGFRQFTASLTYPGFEVVSHKKWDHIPGLPLSEKEKNWTFTSPDRFIYSIEPFIVVSGSTVHQGSGRSLQWKHGQIRGGSNLFKLGSHLGQVVHSSVEIARGNHGPVRQYFAAVVAHNAVTLEPEGISERPIMTGEPCDVYNRPSQHQVVFPCGAMELGDQVVVSYGINDMNCALDVFSKQQITQGLRWL